MLEVVVLRGKETHGWAEWERLFQATTYQWVSEELVLGVVLPEEKLALWRHAGLHCNHQFMIFQAPLCIQTNTDDIKTTLVTGMVAINAVIDFHMITLKSLNTLNQSIWNEL